MLLPFLCSLVSAFKSRRSLALENLALRQQLAVLRSSVLGALVEGLERLDAGAGPGEAGDCGSMASHRLLLLLDLEEPEASAWTTNHQTRGTGTDPEDEQGESLLGSPADSR
jgi:hypothetical protein